MIPRMRRAALLTFISLAASAPSLAAERAAVRKDFHIPSQPLDEALLAFSQQAGVELAAVGDFSQAGRSAAVDGIMTPQAALERLLGDSTFEYAIQPNGMVTVSALRPRNTPASAATMRVERAATTTPIVTQNVAAIVVTARKRDERLIDVPMSVSAVSGDRIELLGLDSAAEVAKLTPAVSSVDIGGSFTQLQIRGVSSSIGGNDNGYYLDDVAFSGVTVPWHPDTRSFDLDRVEILKGPQGTLFGEGSLGGTIRILTRAPELDQFRARAELGFASTQSGGTGNSAKLMANLPLVNDHLALRVVATDETLPGWLDDPDSGRRNDNRQQIATRRARLRWSPDDRWLTDVSFIRSTTDAMGGGYSAGDDDVVEAALGNNSQWQSSSFSSSYLSGRSRFSYLYSDSRLGYQIDGRLNPASPTTGSIDIDVSTQELRWSYSVDDRLDWVAGYAHRRAARTDQLVVAAAVSMASQSNRADTLYGEGTLRSRDGHWSVTAGLRYFLDRVHGTSAGDAIVTTTSDRFESLNPRLIIARQASADRLWYATASTGFRSGQLQPITSLVAAQAVGKELPLSIAPDSITSYELGFKQQLAEQRVLLQAAVFQSRWRDLPVRVPLDDDFNGIANSRGARIRGAEAGLRYNAASSLSLELNAGVVDARYLADVPGTPLRKGSTVYNVPKVTASAAASYAWLVHGDLTAVASATAFYNSARTTSLVVGRSGDAILSASARVGLESPRGWACYLYGDNLGNEDGAVDGRTGFDMATRLRPRTYGIELRYAY